MNLQRAQILAEDLMKHYLSPLQGWGFEFDRSLTRLGYCSFKNWTIYLGKYATSVNSEEQVLGTILHEIAHALVGAHHGHDKVWKAKAIELGHSGQRCGTISIKAPFRYAGICPNCPFTVYRYKARQGTYHKSCGPDTRLVWKELKYGKIN
jgi:predicted SprT family Zn-dependent metalloprotease